MGSRIKRAGAIAILLVTGFISACGAALAAMGTDGDGVPRSTLRPGTVSTIRYLPTDEQTFGRLYLPTRDVGAATVVLIHGGGWRNGVGLDSMESLASSLQRRGHAVWNIEYRRLRSGGGWPTTFSDVGSAVDFMTVLASRTPMIRPGNVIAVGFSAGGQLAAWTATRSVSPSGPGPFPQVTPRAVVSLAGVLDMSATGRVRDGARQVLGGRRSEVPSRYRQVNPIERVNPSVPMTIVHSRDDRVVAHSVATDYVAAAMRRGAAVRLITLPRGGHLAPVTPGPGLEATLQAIEEQTPAAIGSATAPSG